MDDRWFRLGDHGRYHAYGSMTSKPDKSTAARSSKSAVGCAAALVASVLVVWAVLYFSYFGRFTRSYGEAEKVVDELIVPFRCEIVEPGVTVDSLLALPKFAGLKHRAVQPDNDAGEVARFHINNMFEIGVMPDGTIQWHQDPESRRSP